MESKKKNCRSVTLSLPLEFEDAVRHAAREQGLNFSVFARLALEEKINRIEGTKKRKAERKLREVASGY